MPTIFSAIPKGVSVRRLSEERVAKLQGRKFRFTAFDNKGHRAYGQSIRSAIRNLGSDVHVHITK